MAATTARAPSSAQASALQRLLSAYREHETLAAARADPARAHAAAQLQRLGWPSGRDEDWRYAPLGLFERVGVFAPGASAAPAALPPLPAPLPGFERRVYLDGRAPAEHGAAAGDPRPGGPGEAPASEPSWSAPLRFGYLCEMFATETVTVQVRGEQALDLCFLTSARTERAAVYPRLKVQLGPGARLTLIERHLGAPSAPTWVCAAVTVELGRASSLTHYRLQQCGAQVAFADSLSARLEAQSDYRVRHLVLGAAAARSAAQLRLDGPEAHVEWQALALAAGEQNLDAYLAVEHRAEHTRTEEVFRGIAEQRARVAFSGQVQIAAQAAHSEVRQSLRGLIEGEAAEIDLRPRLQIDTDEVRAAHGAATGRLDEALLFYLLSRGLDRAEARALLKWAFLGDVLARIEVPGLRQAVEQAAAGRLRELSPTEAALP